MAELQAQHDERVAALAAERAAPSRDFKEWTLADILSRDVKAQLDAPLDRGVEAAPGTQAFACLTSLFFACTNLPCVEDIGCLPNDI